MKNSRILECGAVLLRDRVLRPEDAYQMFFMVFLLDSKGAEVRTSCRSRQKLSNEYVLLYSRERALIRVWDIIDIRTPCFRPR